jgi:hypothetical protein
MGRLRLLAVLSALPRLLLAAALVLLLTGLLLAALMLLVRLLAALVLLVRLLATTLLLLARTRIARLLTGILIRIGIVGIGHSSSPRGFQAVWVSGCSPAQQVNA